MKLYPGTYLFLVSFVLMLSLACCGGDGDDNDDGTPGTAATLRMKVDGVTWQATKNVSAAVAFISASGNEDGAIIAGRDVNNKLFQLTTAKEIDGPGTYNIPSTTGGGVMFEYNGKTYVQVTLTVIIQEIKTVGTSKKVIGTFQGTLKNLHNNSETLTITEGVFNGAE